ncbi:DUF916 domain-containing protein (plasmid) [Pontibacillus sp. ALD_SL1]|uniref:WxL protein peptidoglycan domain-containing protein n=1 Tax=Pontibacillus sp. ALD_SL1 TaxID=2777185 RepID=UPI001A975FA7|nr:DUF916 domain-containing protein [Pontibacillus sp. ALD_SL1]QST02650.1 DUF916 domain-containing protein [Pontibacillus sp. ALD_SL1]
MKTVHVLLALLVWFFPALAFASDTQPAQVELTFPEQQDAHVYSYFDFKTKKGEQFKAELILRNPNKEEITLQLLKGKAFTLPSGKMFISDEPGYEDSSLLGNRTSAFEWFTLPEKITLKPFERKKASVSFHIPSDVEDGTYMDGIIINTNSDAESQIDEQDGEMAVVFNNRYRENIAVVFRIGEETASSFSPPSVQAVAFDFETRTAPYVRFLLANEHSVIQKYKTLSIGFEGKTHHLEKFMMAPHTAVWVQFPWEESHPPNDTYQVALETLTKDDIMFSQATDISYEGNPVGLEEVLETVQKEAVTAVKETPLWVYALATFLFLSGFVHLYLFRKQKNKKRE